MFFNSSVLILNAASFDYHDPRKLSRPSLGFHLFVLFCFFSNFVLLILQRGEGREKEGENHGWVPPEMETAAPARALNP